MTRDRKALLIVGLAVLLGVWGTGAQDEPVRIGIVDLNQAINATEEGKAAREEMNRRTRAAEQQLQPMVDQAKALDEELKGKRYVLSDEVLFGKRADLYELQNRIESKLQEAKGQLESQKAKLLQPIVSKMNDTVKEIGKEQGFTIILDRSTAGLVYTREALDITNQVTARFNKKKG
jgi:outer membrane protein